MAPAVFFGGATYFATNPYFSMYKSKCIYKTKNKQKQRRESCREIILESVLAAVAVACRQRAQSLTTRSQSLSPRDPGNEVACVSHSCKRRKEKRSGGVDSSRSFTVRFRTRDYATCACATKRECTRRLPLPLWREVVVVERLWTVRRTKIMAVIKRKPLVKVRLHWKFIHSLSVWFVDHQLSGHTCPSHPNTVGSSELSFLFTSCSKIV